MPMVAPMPNRTQPSIYQEQIELLGRNTADVVMQVYRSLLEFGHTTVEEVAEVIGPMLLSSSLEAQSMAQAQLAQQLSVIEGRSVLDELVTDVGKAPQVEDKIRITVRAITEIDGVERELKLERLARSDPLETAQYTYSEGLRKSTNVAGYVRVIEADACELCHWLYRDGYVWPPDKPLTTHPGCVCSAEPVTPMQMIEAAERRFRHRTSQYSEYTEVEWINRAKRAAETGKSPDAWRNPGPRNEESQYHDFTIDWLNW